MEKDKHEESQPRNKDRQEEFQQKKDKLTSNIPDACAYSDQPQETSQIIKACETSPFI